jgi:hypothetical protein
MPKHTQPIEQRIEGIQDMDTHTEQSYKEWITKIPFKWFGTYRIPFDNTNLTTNLMKEHLRHLGKEEKLQVSSFYILNTLPQPHIHALIYSKPNKHNKTLTDCDIKKWEDKWKYKSVIQEIYDLENLIGYMTLNMPEDKSSLFLYGVKHMKSFIR